MNNIMERIKTALWMPSQWDAKARDTLKNSFLFTFLFGLIAHAYQFFNINFSHDSLDRFYTSSVDAANKIGLGRVFVPAYRMLVRGRLETPWTIGLISLIFIALAVYLTARMLRVRTKTALCLIAGVMTVNLTVTAMAATYLYELDCDMLALLAAVAAASCWNRFTIDGKWQHCMAGAILVLLSLGFYQSYVFVTTTLIFMLSILRLSESIEVKKVFIQGLIAIAMLAAGGIMYLLAVNLITRVTGISLITGYNSLSNAGNISLAELPKLVIHTYSDCINMFTRPKSGLYPGDLLAAGNGFMALYLLYALIRRFSAVKSNGARALAAALLLLLPLSMNGCYILTSGMVHDLMRYALWLIYVFSIVLAEQDTVQSNLKCLGGIQALRIAMFSVIAMMLWNSVQTANAAYLKKAIETQSTLSRMTRVADDLSECEGYEPGKTPVVFLGQPNRMEHGFSNVSQITGLDATTAITNDYKTYNAYFQYYLNEPMNAVKRTGDMDIDDVADSLPSFPAEGYYQMHKGILIVKMS